MGIIDELNSNPIPTELFHYTSQAGLIGIIETNSIWASKIHYLNDSTEFELALNLVKEVLNEKRKKVRTTPSRKKIDCFLENIKSIGSTNVCVASLSENRDLLSQWRAYGGGSGGYSIGVKAQNIAKNVMNRGFSLLKCEYDENKQLSLARMLVSECLAENVDTEIVKFNRGVPTLDFSAGSEFKRKLSLLASVLKHKTFKEESEWRLVSQEPISAQDLKFRPGISTVTPYIPVELGEKRYYLQSITAGPTPNPSQAADMLKVLTLKHIECNLKTYTSEVPFRNW
ncbi:DUF2971 domain-containing protein [Marinimicrobium sp. C6131]|uniref:DUF2971 domain-containing protein n=1 Tax=Marinimicrobium sp. C6131 TaxID=3022676 RepID=UPI00223E6082|nr:DUF2971 domain-containing protein [Marinimicrobium sp. C6131]UZJ46175.1 DUF2971 domain-containing protein [Marinimicrobium sp. C6131]